MDDIIINKTRNVSDTVAIVYSLAKNYNLSLSFLHDAVFIKGTESDIENFKTQVLKLGIWVDAEFEKI